MNKEQTIGCPSHKIISHNSNDEEVSTLQDSQYSVFADRRPTSYQPSSLCLWVCGLLPLVFALFSTKLSIFTLVDLVLLAIFTVTSRGRKIQLTTRGQLRCLGLLGTLG